MVWMQPSKSISTQIWGFSKNLNVNPWNKEYFIFHFWSSTETTVKHFWLSQLCDFPGFFLTYVRWPMNCSSSLGGQSVDAAEGLVLSTSHSWFEESLISWQPVSFRSLSPFPFFLWRGISSLGSHIRFVHSSAYPKGKRTLFLWFVGCCQTQPFLQTLIP